MISYLQLSYVCWNGNYIKYAIVLCERKDKSAL